MKVKTVARMELDDHEKEMIRVLMTCQDNAVEGIIRYVEALCTEAYEKGAKAVYDEWAENAKR